MASPDEFSFALILVKKLIVKGMQIRLVMTSAMACDTCIPGRPKIMLATIRTGIKQSPLRSDDKNVALNL